MLRGGLLLSYGLHREAGEIFAQLIEQRRLARGARPGLVLPGQDPLPARLPGRGRRGDRPHRKQAAARRSRKSAGCCSANLLMARGDYAGAAKVLSGMPADQQAPALYARYNLGVALVRSGDDRRAAARCSTRSARLSAARPTEEFRACATRPTWRSASPRCKDDRPEAARDYLERVRLNGLQSNKALLGFGWAAAALKSRKLALVPWTELGRPRRQRRRGARGAHRGALCLCRTGRLWPVARALQRGDRAVRPRERRARRIDRRRSAAASCSTACSSSNPGEEMGWFWNITRAARDAARRPPGAGAGAARVPGGVQELPRPAFLAGNLQHWQDKPRRLRRHARQPPPGLRRAPAQGARAGRATADIAADCSSAATRSRPNSRRPRPRPTAWPSPTPGSAR